MLSEQNKFLETAYRVLNHIYFADELPEVVITIQSSQRTYGHITVRKIWRDGWDCYHEINISAEHLNRPIENIIATLLHECCHLYAMENDIRDTSNGGRYHNKRFKQIAEERDLKISHAQYIGWSVTEPTERLKENIKEYNLDTQFDYVRMGETMQAGGGQDGAGGTDGAGGKLPKKSSTRKYLCVGCHNSVRATKDVNIMCMDCMLPMIKQVSTDAGIQ